MTARWHQRPTLWLVALLAIAYGYFYQAGGWNQNTRIDLTRAIVVDRSVAIDRYARNTGDLARLPGGGLRCDKAPGISMLAVPPMALYTVFGDLTRRGDLARATWFATFVAVGLLSIAGALALRALLLLLGFRDRAAIGWTLVWALGSMAWPYSTLLYGHQVAAALLIIALWLLVRQAQRPASPIIGRAAWPMIGVGAAIGAAVVVEYPSVLGAFPLAGYLLASAGPRQAARHAGWIVVGGLPLALLLGLYHTMAFGGPLTLPYEYSTMEHRHMGFFMGLGAPDFDVLDQLLVSEYRGILLASPWLALVGVGLVRGLQRAQRESRALVITCAAVILLYLWLNTSIPDWDGGWAMGPRYLVPMLPFAVVLAALGLRALTDAARPVIVRHAALGLTIVAAGWSVLWHGAATAVKPEVPMLQVPYEYVWAALRQGHVAISTQGIHMKGAPGNGPRQATNLGEGLGLQGTASLLPLLVVMAAYAVMLWRSSRAQPATPTTTP